MPRRQRAQPEPQQPDAEAEPQPPLRDGAAVSAALARLARAAAAPDAAARAAGLAAQHACAEQCYIYAKGQSPGQLERVLQARPEVLQHLAKTSAACLQLLAAEAPLAPRVWSVASMLCVALTVCLDTLADSCEDTRWQVARCNALVDSLAAQGLLTSLAAAATAATRCLTARAGGGAMPPLLAYNWPVPLLQLWQCLARISRKPQSQLQGRPAFVPLLLPGLELALAIVRHSDRLPPSESAASVACEVAKALSVANQLVATSWAAGRICFATGQTWIAADAFRHAPPAVLLAPAVVQALALHVGVTVARWHRLCTSDSSRSASNSRNGGGRGGSTRSSASGGGPATRMLPAHHSLLLERLGVREPLAAALAATGATDTVWGSLSGLCNTYSALRDPTQAVAAPSGPLLPQRLALPLLLALLELLLALLELLLALLTAARAGGRELLELERAATFACSLLDALQSEHLDQPLASLSGEAASEAGTYVEQLWALAAPAWVALARAQAGEQLEQGEDEEQPGPGECAERFFNCRAVFAGAGSGPATPEACTAAALPAGFSALGVAGSCCELAVDLLRANGFSARADRDAQQRMLAASGMCSGPLRCSRVLEAAVRTAFECQQAGPGPAWTRQARALLRLASTCELLSLAAQQPECALLPACGSGVASKRLLQLCSQLASSLKLVTALSGPDSGDVVIAAAWNFVKASAAATAALHELVRAAAAVGGAQQQPEQDAPAPSSCASEASSLCSMLGGLKGRLLLTAARVVGATPGALARGSFARNASHSSSKDALLPAAVLCCKSLLGCVSATVQAPAAAPAGAAVSAALLQLPQAGALQQALEQALQRTQAAMCSVHAVEVGMAVLRAECPGLAAQLQAAGEAAAAAFPQAFACNEPSCTTLKGLSERACAKSTCSGCRAAHYCGRSCQHRHWRSHKAACKAIQQQRAAQAEAAVPAAPHGGSSH